MTTPAQDSTIQALGEMVADGLLTWASAVMLYREEFGASYLQAADDGAVETCQRADKHWRKKVLLVKSGWVTLAHETQQKGTVK